MTKPVEPAVPLPSVRERIIIALDVDSPDVAQEIVASLGERVGAFKIGLQLYMSAGPSFVRELVEAGRKVFLDLKFHDIPNTVAKASVEATRLGVWMFNMHASGGSRMMRQARSAVDDVCSRESLTRPLMIGVTALTSSTNASLAETGVNDDTASHGERLATLCHISGMDGVVASAREASAIRQRIPQKNFIIVTPGIRAKDATLDDQKRVATLGQAIAAGSDHVVIGRPVIAACDPADALERLIETAKDTE